MRPPVQVRVQVRARAEVEAVDESLQGVEEEELEGRAMKHSVDYF